MKVLGCNVTEQGAFAIALPIAMIVAVLMVASYGCSEAPSLPLRDPKDNTIADLRRQLAEAHAKLKAEATPQSDMVDKMRAMQAQHAKEVAELHTRIGQQATQYEKDKVDSCLVLLQHRLQDTALRLKALDDRLGQMDQRLRGIDRELEDKAYRGHGH
jgi:predicted  nucleic acid-binding Zn-ribbon protein